MTEDFLYFLWQYQYFNKNQLETTASQNLQVISVGIRNKDAGPDFSNARLFIDGLEWVGNIEMHLKASDWHAHTHTNDRAYDSVVLHVVWEEDISINRPDGSILPTLALNKLTDPKLLNNYQQLIDNQSVIPCQNQFRHVETIHQFSMLDKALTQRLERKAEFVHELLNQNQNDWEETAYQLLANNFGFKINAEPMLRLAQSIGLKTLQKHRDNLTQIEAALFGQAGFLNTAENDAYIDLLRRENDFLTVKYGLQNSKMNAHEWKFLRLRPANFPTVRIAQLATLIQQKGSFFSWFINVQNVEDFKKSFQIKQSEYWQKHYLLGKPTESKVPNLGKSSIENVIINTVVPLLVAYSQHRDNHEYLDKAIELLEQLPAEHNHITDQWEDMGLKIKTAFDSQATIELFNNFCSFKKCLSCNVGMDLLRRKV